MVESNKTKGLASAMDPLLSVIVPVYNGKEHIVDCLANIGRQGLEQGECEVIMVDDGSCDGSSDLLDRRAEAMSCLKVLHQLNKGAGAARNAGMDAARGRYIYFLDVDDRLEDGSLRILLDRCLEERLDVLFFAGSIEYAEEDLRRIIPQNDFLRRLQDPGVLDGESMLVKQQRDRNFCAQPCVQVSRTDFLRGERVRFAEGIINEDNLFVLLSTIRAKRVDVDPHRYYNYFVHRDSVTLDNLSGFKRFDAHLWLLHEFQLESFRAEAHGKQELARSIAELSDLLMHNALNAYMGLDCLPSETKANDMISHGYIELFEHLKDCDHEIRSLNQKLNDAEREVRDVRSSTSYRVGNTLIKPLSRLKRFMSR